MGPRFPGDVADHLPARGEPPDRWADRVRGAKLAYGLLAVLGPAWLASLVLMVVYHDSFGVIFLPVVMFPFVISMRIRSWRWQTGRDVDTGERLGPPPR